MRYQKVNNILMAIGDNEQVNTIVYTRPKKSKVKSFFNDFKRFVIITTIFVLGANLVGYFQKIILSRPEYYMFIFTIGMISILWYSFYKLLK